MPEYLAPGVYVEEIDTGNKPIEGVSTSTAGMVGVTERGPVDVPILITSYGEYTRWFGERLNIADFHNANGPHCYLPHAVEGFFTNSGKRVYITRVIGVGATRATFDLHDRGSNTSAWTMLLRSAGELTGVAASPIYVLNVNFAEIPNTGSLANSDRIRIGGGSDAEYRVVDTITVVGNATHVPLSFPLSRAHNAGVPASTLHIPRIALGGTLSLSENALAGAQTTTVVGSAADIGALAVDQILEIGSQHGSEHRFVRGITPVDATHAQLLLDSPLMMNSAAATPVALLDSTVVPVVDGTKTLEAATTTGDRVVFVLNRASAFTNRDGLIIFDNPTPAIREVRRIGNLSLLALSMGAYGVYPAASLIQGVDLADDVPSAAKNLTAPVSAGGTVITLNNRVDLLVGDVVRIGVPPNQEYATIAALPNRSPGGAAPNAGNVVLTHPVNSVHVNGTEVRRQTPPTVRTDRPSTVVVLDVANTGALVPVTDGGPTSPPNRYIADDVIRVTTTAGDVSYHLLARDAAVLDARPITLTTPLGQAHAAGSPVAERGRLLTAQALDAGAWGNRLRISIEDETPGLVARTILAAVSGPTRIRLGSAAGVEAGTMLELLDPNTGDPVGDPLKVLGIDRSTGEITLDAAASLSAAQVAAAAALPPGIFLGIRSREFRMTVHLLRQPDPLLPSRNDAVLNTEVFRYLSMDPRHSRYVQTVIGDINGPPRLSDHRSDGESWYIRVSDITPGTGSRLGPEALIDVLPDGRQRPARHPLADGNDSLLTLDDTTYIGLDDPNPENRTGLHTLRNIDEISIISCPGRTSVIMQNALINQCELMRYRFAVLDAVPHPHDALADVQNQRQQFDTKYAAIYHPWLLISNPFPSPPNQTAEYRIPPSGHVAGIYARTDIERGVHKAPANEVVRGIIGLQRLLNKEQQDILNPYPVNINVIRDFRDNNRGIRVFGGRVITSDSDWKYVNVRRRLIFIENSIDRGLQWVVFEPNAEPLWARVRRSISNFLTLVWRNGALEGTKVEEAYFVKCDRTTMTQTDIDSGRLIVVVGVAPVKPAEFVIIRIGLWTARADN